MATNINPPPEPRYYSIPCPRSNCHTCGNVTEYGTLDEAARQLEIASEYDHDPWGEVAVVSAVYVWKLDPISGLPVLITHDGYGRPVFPK